ncbi:MAG TPA: ABC transporter ATP-binding protein [Acidobacteriaceae bacterium]|jgi:ABC-type multidrug transport system ATPase subunit|nr:ABC transporter ATP-binding protein [Acidobacteriaceae bacterium]
MQNVEPHPADSSTTPAASLSQVSKLFGSFAALRKVSVEFEPGSSTMVLGDNGAGKSTMLRLIAGLITPSRGTVLTFGADPHRNRQRIAYMSHEPMLYDELSALENLRYFATLYYQCEGEDACACSGSPETALRAVGLDPALTRPVGQYSQGMRQRASLARVLQADPEILLLDEPFSNLDVASAKQMVDLLRDFRTWPVHDVEAPRRRTIILTTHQAHLAETLAEAKVTMRAGAVISVEGAGVHQLA